MTSPLPVPDMGVQFSQSLLPDADQFRVPPPLLEMKMDCGGVAVPELSEAKMSWLRFTLIKGKV
jgi:hypothetical protein